MAAKISSKNNPNTRGKAHESLYNGKKIKPVKLITVNSTYFGAEYENGELVIGRNGNPMAWSSIPK